MDAWGRACKTIMFGEEPQFKKNLHVFLILLHFSPGIHCGRRDDYAQLKYFLRETIYGS